MQSGGGGGGSAGGGMGSLFGGFAAAYTQAKANKKAARALQESIARAEVLWKEERTTQLKLYEPYMTSGTWATGELQKKVGAGPGEYKESPYYNFLLEEGVKTRERSAASRGGLLSGAEQKELTKYGQGAASTDYDTWLKNWYNSLVPYNQIANRGLAATGAYSGQEMNIQNALANLTLGSGSVEAQEVLNKGQIMASQQQQTGNTLGTFMASGSGGGGGQQPQSQPQYQNYLNDLYSKSNYYQQNPRAYYDVSGGYIG